MQVQCWTCEQEQECLRNAEAGTLRAALRICLEDALQIEGRDERSIQFGIDSHMLEEVVGSFHFARLCKDIPDGCRLHPEAARLLLSVRTASFEEEPECMVVFVDGAFDPVSGAGAWAVAVLDHRPTEIVFGLGAWQDVYRSNTTKGNRQHSRLSFSDSLSHV